MPTYSHSRLSTFEKCPLQYSFRYLERPEVEGFTSIGAFLGSRAHDALEKLYQDLFYEKLLSIDELLAFFVSEWEKNFSPEVKVIKDGYEAGNYLQMGQRFLRDYYERYHPFDQGRTLGLEERVVVELGGKYRLCGYIDRLTLRDGIYEIHDYKTSSSLPSQEKVDADRQLALYAIAVREMFPDAENVELVWHYLAFDREMRSKRTDESLEELEKETVELIEEIEAAGKRGDFPPHESPLCRWCEFQTLCPRFKHVAKVRQLPLEKYLKEPGVVLVNKLVELNAKKREFMKKVEVERKAVKEALFQLAEEENLEVVAGSDHKARIKVYEKVKFPGKNDEKREELERLVREEGLWETLSTLDTYALAKLIEKGELPSGFEKKLEEFKRLEERRRIYVSSL